MLSSASSPMYPLHLFDCFTKFGVFKSFVLHNQLLITFQCFILVWNVYKLDSFLCSQSKGKSCASCVVACWMVSNSCWSCINDRSELFVWFGISVYYSVINTVSNKCQVWHTYSFPLQRKQQTLYISRLFLQRQFLSDD